MKLEHALTLAILATTVIATAACESKEDAEPQTAAAASEGATTPAGGAPSVPPTKAGPTGAHPSPAAQPSGAAAAGMLALGGPAPMTEVAMKNVDGQELTIASVKGDKGTLVIFTCNHCPWAKAWHERITALGNQYAARGFGVIAVNPNDPAQYEEDGFEPMQALAESSGMKFPYVVDATSGVARAYGATKTPEAFLFDAEMKLVYHGAIDDDAHEEGAVEHHYLRDALEAVAGGTPVAEAETRAIGCSIKFREAS